MLNAPNRLLLRGGTILTLAGGDELLPKADILVESGRIAAIGDLPAEPRAVAVVSWIFPGNWWCRVSSTGTCIPRRRFARARWIRSAIRSSCG